MSATSLAQVRSIPIANVIEIGFSPKGTFISTCERQQKADEHGVHKNLKVWNVQTGEQVASFGQKNQEGCIQPQNLILCGLPGQKSRYSILQIGPLGRYPNSASTV
ncbi:hypothetical protein FRC18_002716 [Serendipita sp. 400]|nr:hypothetical protein FRC18_002716 [Serendipita sp. 400]